jgi:septal ring factor EnvC (AmiA/AmiB activator)
VVALHSDSSSGSGPIAKNQNTFAKRQREMEKKAKAEAKRQRRDERKEEGDTDGPAIPIISDPGLVGLED